MCGLVPQIVDDYLRYWQNDQRERPRRVDVRGGLHGCPNSRAQAGFPSAEGAVGLTGHHAVRRTPLLGVVELAAGLGGGRAGRRAFSAGSAPWADVRADVVLVVAAGNAVADSCPERSRVLEAAAEGVRSVAGDQRGARRGRRRPGRIAGTGARCRAARPGPARSASRSRSRRRTRNSPLRLAARCRHPIRSAERVSCHGVGRCGMSGQLVRRPSRPRLIHRTNSRMGFRPETRPT
jgi:hypothetical protein